MTDENAETPAVGPEIAALLQASDEAYEVLRDALDAGNTDLCAEQYRHAAELHEDLAARFGWRDQPDTRPRST